MSKGEVPSPEKDWKALAGIQYPPSMRKMIGERLAQERFYDDLAFEEAARQRGIDLANLTVSASPSPPAQAGGGSNWQAEGDEFDVDEINREFAFVLNGGTGMIVRTRPSAAPENRFQFIKVDGFKLLFANRFKTVRGPDGKEKAVSWGICWLQDKRRRQHDGIEFHPDPENEGGTPGHLNLWQGFGHARSKAGSYAIFRDHLLTNVCHGDETLFAWLFGWFANIFQRPREKPGTSIVLRGGMGVGKSKVGEVFGELLGAHYFQVDDPRYVTGQFNHHMAACLLLQGEEAVWAGDKTAEGRLKGLITSEYQMIEAKGVDAVRLRNFVRVIQTSNEDWVVPAGKDERRFAIFDVGSYCANNHTYFGQMDDELQAGGFARLLDDLLSFDLASINLRDIPKTAALLDQKIRSLDPIEAWLFDRLRAGAPAKRYRNWPDHIPVDVFRDDYLRTSDEVGVRRKAHETQFGMKIAKLLPSIGRSRRYVEDEEGATMHRKWCYELPPLQDCRDDFDRALGQNYDWGGDEVQPVQPSQSE